MPDLNQRLAQQLLDSAVGVLPTDTIYGLVCSVAHEAAVRRLYDLKNREHKPGTIIAADVAQLKAFGVDPLDLQRSQPYWPGPVCIVLAHPHVVVSQEVGSQPFRIPSDKKLRSFLSLTGPLLTTSANAPGKPPANTVNEAKAYFGSAVDFYVDGGDLSGRLPSTIIRFSENGEVQVLRQGAALAHKV